MTQATTQADLIALAERLCRDTDNGCSVVLDGSMNSEVWANDPSEVRILVVVDDPSPISLTRLTPAIGEWQAQGHLPPLVIGRKEWGRAADSFPIEITDMQVDHLVLAGEDPVAGIKVNREELRRALEVAFREKVIRLRQAYIRFAETEPVLGGFVRACSSGLLVLLRAMAVLWGRPPGTTPEATLAALAELLGDDVATLRAAVARRLEPDRPCTREEFTAYMEAIERLADRIDALAPAAS